MCHGSPNSILPIMLTRRKHIQIVLERAVKDCYTEHSQTALFLSGGLDSAIVQAIGKFDHLYCCTWPEDNNLDMATLAAGGKEVTPVTFTKEDLLEVVPVVRKLTEGTGTWSQVCQYLMAQRAAADGCDMVLTGEGADELFGGYTRYRVLFWLDKMFQDPLLIDYRPIMKHMFGSRKQMMAKMLARTMDRDDVQRTLDANPDPGSLVKWANQVDGKEGLPPLLKNETACIEAAGVKVGYPFMSTELWNFTVSAEEMITLFENKHLLRNVARSLGVHSEIIQERTKKGLVIPQAWRPEGAPMWSTGWFIKLMRE